MLASEFLDRARSARSWRNQARALRRSADVLWDDFTCVLTAELKLSVHSQEGQSFDRASEAFEVMKLLFGLALETALKAWIVEHFPERVEIKVVVNGAGEATQAELRTFGVPTSSGHNILALAEAAGVFSDEFAHILPTEDDRRALKNICRDLGEVVVWRGRYPIPLGKV